MISKYWWFSSLSLSVDNFLDVMLLLLLLLFQLLFILFNLTKTHRKMLRSLQFFLSKSVSIEIIFRSFHSSRLRLVCSLSSRVNNNGSSVCSKKLAIVGHHHSVETRPEVPQQPQRSLKRSTTIRTKHSPILRRLSACLSLSCRRDVIVQVNSKPHSDRSLVDKWVNRVIGNLSSLSLV